MKTVLMTIAALSLFLGMSSCAFPGGAWRQHQYEHENGALGNPSGRQIGVRGQQSKRDCVIRDGHRYCRDGT